MPIPNFSQIAKSIIQLMQFHGSVTPKIPNERFCFPVWINTVVYIFDIQKVGIYWKSNTISRMTNLWLHTKQNFANSSIGRDVGAPLWWWYDIIQDGNRDRKFLHLLNGAPKTSSILLFNTATFYKMQTFFETKFCNFHSIENICLQNVQISMC